MTTINQPADPQAAQPAQPSPYPTVQILQAAMAHRDSIRRSFESQRATLAEAIAAQRQAVTQAVVNTHRSAGVQQGYVQPEPAGYAEPEPDPGLAPEVQEACVREVQAQVPMPVGSTPTEKLVVALSLLTTPGSVAAKNAAAHRAVATQQFVDALKVLISEEIARRIAPRLAVGSASPEGDAAEAEPAGNPGSSDAIPPPPPASPPAPGS
jgi:hypothetical protein